MKDETVVLPSNNWLYALLSVFSFIVFAVLAFVYINWKDIDLARIVLVPVKISVIVILLYVVQVCAQVKLLHSFFGKEVIGFKEFLGLNFFAIFLNSFVSRSGSVAIVTVLKLKHDVTIKDTFKKLIVCTVYTAIFFGVIGGGVLLYAVTKSLMLGFSSILLGVVITLIFKYWKKHGSVLFTQRMFYLAVILTTTWLRLVVLFSYLQTNVTLLGGIALAAFYNLAPIVSITPAALGFREAILYGIAVITTEGVNTIIEVSIIDRLLSLLILIPVGLSYVFTYKRIRKKN